MNKSMSVASKFFCLVAAVLCTTTLSAQLDVDVDINKGEWYENPVYWVVGLLVLILVVLLARRGGSK